jgi:hypothetical protein
MAGLFYYHRQNLFLLLSINNHCKGNSWLENLYQPELKTISKNELKKLAIDLKNPLNDLFEEVIQNLFKKIRKECR